MKTKRIIACIISCVLFMMCIPFTAVAEDLDTGLDRYRKYYSPAYTLESCTYTDSMMVNKTVAEDSVYFWNDIRHYSETYNDLKTLADINDDEFYIYIESPITFSYNEFMSNDDCQNIPVTKDVSENGVQYGYPIQSEFFVNNNAVGVVKKESSINTSIQNIENALKNLNCEKEMYILSDNKNRVMDDGSGVPFCDYMFNGNLFRKVYTSYRIGTVCEIRTIDKFAWVFVPECYEPETIVNIFSNSDLDYNLYNYFPNIEYLMGKKLGQESKDYSYAFYGTGYENIMFGSVNQETNMPNNTQSIELNYVIGYNAYKDEYWNNTRHFLKFTKELDPNVNYDKNLEVYADTFNVSIPVTTDDGVRFVDNDYTIKFWYDGSFQIDDSGEKMTGVTGTSFYWNRKESDYKQGTSSEQYINCKYQNVNKVTTYGDTLNYDADNDKLCTIRNGKITYLTEDQLHYTLNIYADNGTETTKVASYDIQLYAPQQRRTIIYNLMTQEKPIVDPVTEYQYKTITYNNGSSTARIKTNTDISDIQEYINKLEAENALLRQENTELKNRINLLSTGTYGDVNGDGVVDVQDAQIILAYYTERDVAKKSVPDLVTFGLKFGKE